MDVLFSAIDKPQEEMQLKDPTTYCEKSLCVQIYT